VRRLETILSNIFGAAFLVLAVAVAIETMSRKLFNFSLQGADELGGYCLAVGSTMAFCLALMGRNHIRVDVFCERFPTRVKAFFNWFAVLTLAGVALILVFTAQVVIRESYQFGSTAQTPWATPLVYPQSVWFAGLIMFAVIACIFAARATYLYFTGRLDALNHDFSPKSTKEEVKEELDDFAQRATAAKEPKP
jgi:TRAP-type C4-dicarboxylate transport system permease small subunit